MEITCLLMGVFVNGEFWMLIQYSCLQKKQHYLFAVLSFFFVGTIGYLNCIPVVHSWLQPIKAATHKLIKYFFKTVSRFVTGITYNTDHGEEKRLFMIKLNDLFIAKFFVALTKITFAILVVAGIFILGLAGLLEFIIML